MLAMNISNIKWSDVSSGILGTCSVDNLNESDVEYNDNLKP